MYIMIWLLERLFNKKQSVYMIMAQHMFCIDYEWRVFIHQHQYIYATCVAYMCCETGSALYKWNKVHVCFMMHLLIATAVALATSWLASTLMQIYIPIDMIFVEHLRRGITVSPHLRKQTQRVSLNRRHAKFAHPRLPFKNASTFIILK